MCSMLQRRLTRAVQLGRLVARKQAEAGEIELAKHNALAARKIHQIIIDLYGPQAGNIGEPIRHVELPGEEPLTVPDFDPAETPHPEEAPVETPAEPEKVPA